MTLYKQLANLTQEHNQSLQPCSSTKVNQDYTEFTSGARNTSKQEIEHQRGNTTLVQLS